MTLNPKHLTLFFISALAMLACNSNNDSEPEPEQATFLCCGDNPFANLNVDNLDQSLGEIKAMGAFTPNMDGMNEVFFIQNIELYPNNTVTIFDLNDNVVFNTSSYGNDPFSYENNTFKGENQSDDSELPTGTYKYKIVVENEDTFVEFGYMCLIRYFSFEELGDASFINCDAQDQVDPFLAQ